MPSSLSQILIGRVSSTAGLECADSYLEIAKSVEAAYDCTDVLPYLVDVPPPLMNHAIPSHIVTAIVGRTDPYGIVALTHVRPLSRVIESAVFLQFEDEEVRGPFYRIFWPVSPQVGTPIVQMPKENESELPVSPDFLHQMTSIIVGSYMVANICGDPYEKYDEVDGKQTAVLKWHDVEEAGWKVGRQDPLDMIHKIKPPLISADGAFNRFNLLEEDSHWLT